MNEGRNEGESRSNYIDGRGSLPIPPGRHCGALSFPRALPSVLPESSRVSRVTVQMVSWETLSETILNRWTCELVDYPIWKHSWQLYESRTRFASENITEYQWRNLQDRLDTTMQGVPIIVEAENAHESQSWNVFMRPIVRNKLPRKRWVVNLLIWCRSTVRIFVRQP